MTSPVPRALLTALLALVAGCAHGPAPPTDWNWHLCAADAELRGFRDARSLLDGFDPAQPGERVAAGDRALFGVCLLDGGERREWFVRLTALRDERDPGEPPEVEEARARGKRLSTEAGLMGTRVRVEVFDADLSLLADDEVGLLEAFFGGAFHGCREPRQPSAPDWNAPYAPPSADTRGHWAVGDVVRIVQKTDSLMSILREIASLPPLWTLLRGVSVSYGMAFGRAVPTTTTEGALAPAFAFPLHILINSRPALLCTVTAAEPVPPLRVCGGFTRLVACDPEDHDRRVVLMLLAARSARGPRSAVQQVVEHIMPLSFGAQHRPQLQEFVRTFFEYRDDGMFD